MTSANGRSNRSTTLLQRAISFVRSGEGLEDCTENVVGLLLPKGGEADERVAQVRHIVDLLEKYHADANADRPLSIVVFGPPGSGKSHFVRSITEAVTGCILVDTINLTQTPSVEKLIERLEKIPELKEPDPAAPSEDITNTPVLFFDEFDTSLKGIPLGWLSWFLAPMQDGVVETSDKPIKVRKAVFIFAGGTAETLDEFNLRARLSPEAYRARKVPDFVSRLRGAINIGGLNGIGDERIISRALVLSRFGERTKGLSDTQIDRLLSNGHFVHGVRSMKTLLDAGWSEDGQLDLPLAIRRQHFSRGELDGRLIGISAGLAEPAVGPVFSTLTTQLLRSGAALAYGGAFTPEGTLQQVLNAERDAPPELDGSTGRSKRVRNYLGYPATLNELSASAKELVDFISLKSISDDELEELGAPIGQWFRATVEAGEDYDPRRHVAWAISLFRLRVRMLQDVSALVVIGGKDDGVSWGRFAGIAEEAMIAVALRKPVFIMGGARGAAKAVGQLLGLDTVSAGLESCLIPPKHKAFDHALVPYMSSFDIPGVPQSPYNLTDLRHFLFHRGITTSAWTWNGLDQAENRELFACRFSEDQDDADRAVELIVQGLARIDWKPLSGGNSGP